MTVYLFYTRHSNGEIVLLDVYKKSSYQRAYNRMADIAERCGDKVRAGANHVAVETHSIATGQVWYLERHDCK